MVLRVALAAFAALGIGAPARQTSDPSAAQAAWVRAHALTVKTVQAGNGFDDLQKLTPSIGTARIVSLGEATHGTREIFQMKHRLVEFLASERGFTIFAIEANMPEAYRVNDYVLHGTGDPKALLKGMYFWTWNTEEVLAMIEWMRQFNASGKGRIEFTGFDMQTPTVAMQNVRDFLATADAEYAKTAGTVYTEVAGLRGSQGAGAFGVAVGTFPVKAAAGHKIRFSGAIRTENLAGGMAGLWWRADGPKNEQLAFDNMQTRGPSGTTDWKRYEIVLDVPASTVNINFGVLMPGTGSAWFDDLRIEIDGAPYDAAELFDLDFESGQIKGFRSSSTAYIVRTDDTVAAHGTYSLKISRQGSAPAAPAVSAAEVTRKCGDVLAHMTQTRQEYLKRGDARAIDWAVQNARVVHQYAQLMAGQVSRDESMARNVKWILDTAPKDTRVVLWAHNGHVGRGQIGTSRAMGSYLDEWYGRDHVVVGFACNRGEYTAVGQGTGLGRHPLKAAEAGSYEYVFARTGIPRFILDVRAARPGDPASEWLLQPLQLRSIGALAMDQQFYPANLSKLFDLVVFLDETTATRGLGQTGG
jgi:erythromycin esterase-like protein